MEQTRVRPEPAVTENKTGFPEGEKDILFPTEKLRTAPAGTAGGIRGDSVSGTGSGLWNSPQGRAQHRRLSAVICKTLPGNFFASGPFLCKFIRPGFLIILSPKKRYFIPGIYSSFQNFKTTNMSPVYAGQGHQGKKKVF
jgi:hypothetical protein